VNRSLFYCILTLIVFVSDPLLAAGQSPVKGYCPVMPGERVKDKFHVDYEGKRIFLCCRSCIKAFKKNPRKYLKRLEETEKGKS